jgi:hypothetical protein
MSLYQLIMASINVPQSAKDHLTAIKTIHRGSHGATVFAIVKNQPQGVTMREALRIVNSNSCITKGFVDKLKAIQDDASTRLVRILEHDADLTCYAMPWFRH